MPRKVFYTKHMINDDGSIAVMDATDEIIRIKRELKRPKDANGTMSVEEVAAALKIQPETVRNKIYSGKFAEGIHYKRLSKKKVVFYRKAIDNLLGLS